MKNKILEKDIENLISHKNYFKDLEGYSVLITGSTGLIGSILVRSLIRNGNIKVYAACRDKQKFETMFSDYHCENLIPIYSDILSLDISNINVDYIVHGASITDSKTFIDKPVETIDIAIDGTRNLLKQCIGKKLRGIVYISSLEVYGTFNCYDGIMNVKETDSGYIDTMAVRSSYSEGKRMVENICKAYQSEYNLPIKVARLCQTFGAGVEYNDNRVFAQFARSIIEHKNIVLKTKGETIRNYCYTTDAVSGLLTILIKGKVGEAYNIANIKTTISIADMAHFVCNMYPDSGSKVVFDIAEDATKLGYNPIVKLQLSSEKLLSLGWKPDFELEDMFRNLIEGMKCCSL